MKLRTSGIVVGVSLLGALAVALPGTAGGNKGAPTASTRYCADGDSSAPDSTGTKDTVTLNGPLKLWPPNHKFVDEPVTAQDDDNAGGVSLTLTPQLADATGGDGGANHDPDWNSTSADGKTFTASDTDGSVTAAFQLRAERSGKGEGRTYTIAWTATFDGQQCSSSDAGQTPFVITVPHDMRGGANWK